MSRFTRHLAPLIACLVMIGCSSALRWAPEYYVVQGGDTIYSIAFRYGIDQRDLLAWNRIDNASLIRPGQRLRLSPPSGGAAGSRSTTPKIVANNAMLIPMMPYQLPRRAVS